MGRVPVRSRGQACQTGRARRPSLLEPHSRVGMNTTDQDIELFRLHRAEQSKYVYFILAAAAGGIALAVRMTADATLHWSLAPLGAAVLSWGLSFFHGCRNLQYVQEVTAKNAQQLKFARGGDPVVGHDPARRELAVEVMKGAIERENTKA